MPIRLLVRVSTKGGSGSGNWGHTGRPGVVGGSGGSGGRFGASFARAKRKIAAGEFGKGSTTTRSTSDVVEDSQVRDKYPDAPIPNPPDRDMHAFLREEGPVELYHITDGDYVDSIVARGLIPGEREPIAQYWKPPHASYATYFFTNYDAAVVSRRGMIELAGGNERAAVMIKVTLPRTTATALRILPDEDVSLNANDGLKALRNGESVAVIGGAAPEYIDIIS